MSIFKDVIMFFHGFRKLTVMLLLIVCGVAFRISDLITGAEFVDLLRYTGVAFFAGNSVEHIGKTVVEWIKNR